MANTDGRLVDLLLRWEELRAAGKTVVPAGIYTDAGPLPAFKWRINQIATLAKLAARGSGASSETDMILHKNTKRTNTAPVQLWAAWTPSGLGR